MKTIANNSLDCLNQFSNLLEILEYWSKTQPENTAYISLRDGETEETKLNYVQLWAKVQAIASQLQKAGATNERVLLLYPSGSLDFVTGFLGCLLASAIAVPVYPPSNNQKMSRLQGIVKDAIPKFALTHSSLLDKLEKWFNQEPSLTNLKLFASDIFAQETVINYLKPELNSEQIAFLQYTSGSTGNPKGVIVSHGNLLHNEQLVEKAFGHSKKTIFVGWLPLFHDMGLMGNILQPLYLGIPCILMSPEAFIQKPYRWLKAISDYKATTSGGPNFAYELCVEKITPEERATLDLSSWQKAFNGAEPIRATTIETFSKMFAECGFNSQAFYPCYGMAETTLFVTGGEPEQPPNISYFDQQSLAQNKAVLVADKTENNCALVSSGKAWLGTKIRIVNPNSLCQCAEGEVGEIWVQNDSVAQGYWHKLELTNDPFKACIKDSQEGEFLRTGDLGFMLNGELFVIGRHKDLIIIRGRNYYPQDIELTVEQSHEALNKGAIAACSVEINHQEQLVIIAELKRQYLRNFEPDSVINNIRQQVSKNHELSVYGIALLKTVSLPKTSSGKIKHHACKQGFIDQKLNEVYRWINPINTPNSNLEETQMNELNLSMVADIKMGIVSRIARYLKAPITQIDPQLDVPSYLDSCQCHQLVSDLETWLEISIVPDLLLECSSIENLANHLAQTVN
jgi:myxalamid-type polyketide synthase MxaB